MSKSLATAFQTQRRAHMVGQLAGLAEIASACRSLWELPATANVDEAVERKLIDLVAEISMGLVTAMPEAADILDTLGVDCGE